MSSRAKTPAQLRRGYAAHCRRYERAIRKRRVSDNALFWFVVVAGFAVIVAGSICIGVIISHG